MAARSHVDPWRHEAALRSARVQRARSRHEKALSAFARLGLGDLFTPVMREAEAARQLGLLIERNQASAELIAIVPTFESFARWCREQRALVRKQVSAAKENAPTRKR